MEQQRKTTSAYKETVLTYVEHGYTLFPLSGKHPQKGQDEWQNLRYNPDLTPQDFPGNFGVVLQADDLVIDVDPRHFKPKENPIKKLSKDLNIELNSCIIQTGGGGYHIYLKKPPEVPIKKSLPAYEGLDFLSKGTYVVGVGCIHPDTGKKYDFLSGSFDNIMYAPIELLDLIINESPLLKNTGIDSYEDDIQAIARFKEYLKYAPVAIQGQHGDKTTFQTACRGRDFGLSEQKCFDIISEAWNPKCQPPWDVDELKRKVKNGYNYNTDVAGKRHPRADFPDAVVKEKIKWDRTASGEYKKTLTNVVNFFISVKIASELSDLLRFNMFNRDIEFKKPAIWHKGDRFNRSWTDSDAIQLKYHLSNVQHFEPSIQLIHEAAEVVAKINSYHPVRDYLEGLTWDGTVRTEKWLTDYCGCKDDKYTRMAGKTTLLAAIARIYDPGIKFDHMLVLEGNQGIGKSTVCNILGGEWYGDILLNAHDKDTIDAMRNKWIIEVSEMECTRRVETQALKAFISRQVDRVRPAYARITQDFPRQSIFLGTINPEAELGYLKDMTGNRRFWPVEVHYIDMARLRKDRNQIWAEILHTYKQGVNLYITDTEVADLAEEEADKRRVKDPWLEKVDIWLSKPDDEGYRRDVVTGLEVFEDCIGGTARYFTRREQNRIANIMYRELRWRKSLSHHPRLNKTCRVYMRPHVNGAAFIGKVEEL